MDNKRVSGNLPAKDQHGINVPLFALHSANSCGIGEYLDLIPLISWCKEVGLDVLQLLPLNDTGPDPSPYSALSAFALNPLYLSLHALPKAPEPPKVDNTTQRIDYPKVAALKETFLRDYYKAHRHTYDLQAFSGANPWIIGYGLFKALKEERKWESWEHWDPSLLNPTEETLNTMVPQYFEEILYHVFVQKLCFDQLIQVRQHADQEGIQLKGDIPILLSRESADVWLYPHLFDTSLSAGAPPDMYNANGQNWGFPLYHWEDAHVLHWWDERLKVAELFFHLYRLDHIVGFYRIWAFGPEGPRYHPEDPSLWIPHGEQILHFLLEKSPMRPIGEDLGTVPAEVKASLNNLGIPGTKVVRWERRWEGDQSFIPPEEYPRLSMTTVSTHDVEPLTLWWSSHPDESRAYAKSRDWEWAETPSTEQLEAMLYESHHSNSLYHINLLNEYLATIPGMHWDDPRDERINVPGVISDTNWSTHFRPSVEEIVSSAPLKALFARMELS